MFYHLVKALMTLSLRLYFGRIRVQGMELIDREGPVIILANHTNSFMDAMITGICLKRRIHFFVRGDVFGHRLAGRLFRQLGMMPVYRLKEGKENLGLNDTSNQEALAVLERGGAVLIFAEGQSALEKTLKPLKKGPFRLAVMTVEKTQVPLRLVPLGINYLDPMATGTDVWLRAAGTMDAREQLLKNEGNAAKTATDLMRQASGWMEPVVVHAENAGDAVLLQGLLELAEEEEVPAGKLSFTTIKTWEQKLKAAPEDQVGELKEKLGEYRELLKAVGLKNWRSEGRLLWLDVLLVVAGAIPALAGWLFHIVPVAIARRLTDKKLKDPDFYASVFCVGAVLLSLCWYLLALVTALCFFKGIQVVLAGLLLAAAGVFYLRLYRPALSGLLQLMQQQTLHDQYPRATDRLRELRKEMLGWLKGDKR